MGAGGRQQNKLIRINLQESHFGLLNLTLSNEDQGVKTKHHGVDYSEVTKFSLLTRVGSEGGQ